MTINSVALSGNLTRDAELRRTQNDMAVLGFGLAFNDRRRKPDTDEWEEIPNFIDCTLFGNRAEALQQYLAKGTKVAIIGRLRWSQWEAEDGTRRTRHEVIVDELEFMTPRKPDAAE